jgi:radical SAM superfamily enzyme YgiQ (UPF0313 family)
VQGEGDFTLPEILQHLGDRAAWDVDPGHHLPRRATELHATPRRELLKAMDEMPWPAYHLYDMRRYMAGMVNPGISIMTSRGCPYSCTFCDAEMTPRSTAP